MDNDKYIRTLTFKQFKDWCNERACDGQWSMGEAIAYSAIINEIDSITVKAFNIIPLPIKTKIAREKKWQKMISK